MTRIEKIPLANRLRQAGAKQAAPCFLHAYRFYLDTYFYGLTGVAGDDRILADILNGPLAPYAARYGETPLLVEFAANSAELPAAERGEVLYQLLARPFAALEEKGE